jgi:hypothetical protein
MTTPAKLAETIARLRSCTVNVSQPDGIRYDDLMTAIRCTERCDAIDSLCSSDLDQARDWADILKGDVPQGLFAAVIDGAAESQSLRSERDALAKRVRELESTDFMAYTNELVAESARLRAENERVRADNRMLLAKVDDATERAEDAQDRVRELEDTLAIVRHNEARLTEVSMCRSRLLAEHGIKEPLYPVTGNQPGNEEDAVTLRKMAASIRDMNRPACIPADCQHYIQLPSGLWAWVENYGVHIQRIDYPAEAPEHRRQWSIYSQFTWAMCDVPGITHADFLAARALGVRVLGWAK